MTKRTHYIDSIYYDLELTANVMKVMGVQLFERLGTDITPMEHAALDTIFCNTGICQRDLAKLILKDRANTGKLIDSLDKKGFVTRHLSIKNNRPVKIAKITPEGVAKLKDVHEKLEPHSKLVQEKIHNSDIAKVSDLLKELREFLGETLEMKI